MQEINIWIFVRCILWDQFKKSQKRQHSAKSFSKMIHFYPKETFSIFPISLDPATEKHIMNVYVPPSYHHNHCLCIRCRKTDQSQCFLWLGFAPRPLIHALRRDPEKSWSSIRHLWPLQTMHTSQLPNFSLFLPLDKILLIYWLAVESSGLAATAWERREGTIKHPHALLTSRCWYAEEKW